MVRFSPFKQSVLVSGGNDGTVSVWDTSMKCEVNRFEKEHKSRVSALCFSTFNQCLLSSVSFDQNVNFYDIKTNRVVKSLKTDSPLTSLAFYQDGKTIAVGTLYGKFTGFLINSLGNIYIYDLRQSANIKLIMNGHDSNCVNHLDFIKSNSETLTHIPRKGIQKTTINKI